MRQLKVASMLASRLKIAIKGIYSLHLQLIKFEQFVDISERQWMTLFLLSIW